MALSGSERWTLGFVFDGAYLASTTSLVGARWWSGFLRDSDGRLVTSAGPGFYRWGFIRDAAGALVVAAGVSTPPLGRYTFAPAAAPFVYDTFTDTDGVAAASHTGETGATWTKHTSYASGGAVISNANRARVNAGNTTCYHASGVPPTADYSVEAPVLVKSVTSGSITGVAGRVNSAANTMYAFRYNQTSAAWEIQKLVAGASTVPGGAASFAQVLTVGQEYVCKLVMLGTLLTGFVDGVQRCTYTDGAITAKGLAGFRLLDGSSASNITGLHLSSLTAT